MGKKDEERELLRKIAEYKKEYRVSYEKELFKECEARYINEEVFLQGFWLNKQSLIKIQQRLKRKKRIAFIEIHALFLVVIFTDLLLLLVFTNWFLK